MEKKFFEEPTIHVGEVNINVTDLEKSLAFYQDVIGFGVLERTDRKAVLTADGKTSLLILEQPSDVIPKESKTTGLFHFAILLPERKDLAAFLSHLIRHVGSQIQLGASDHVVSEALYFADPDGNGIEMAHDRPSSEWQWTDGNVTMRTDPLDGDGLLKESTHEWTGLPEETVMGHIHLHVSELEKTEEYYVKALGFDVVTNYPGAIFISNGGYHHHIALNVWNGVGVPVPSENSVGLNWYTLVFPDETTRRDKVEQLEQIGAHVTREAWGYVTTDPSGNSIHLVLED